MGINYQPCQPLRLIPDSKFNIYKAKILEDCQECKSLGHLACEKCVLKSKIIYRYQAANIPLDYWNRTINDFQGDKKLVNLYNKITEDLPKAFEDGKSYILKGLNGVGKTFFSSLLLKKIVEKGYIGLYTTLSDIVSLFVYGKYEDKYLGDKDLKMTDFLVIDEFDSRYMGSEASAELFGRLLEQVLRIRLQNKLPTILITNNADPTKALGDALSTSIDSLIAGHMKEVFVIGKDFRKGDK